MTRAVSLLNQLVSLLAGLALLVIAVVGAVDIVARLAGSPIAGAYEITETLMVILVFLGIAKAEEQNRHISVQLLVDRFRPKARIFFHLFGTIVSALLFVAIAWFGWAGALRSFATGEFQAGEISFPLWPARLILAFGASMMVLQCLVNATGDILALLGRRAAVLSEDNSASI